MNERNHTYLTALKCCLVPLASILFYVILISIFAFVHFHLNHDMFTINSWIGVNKWPILFLIKFLVMGFVTFWMVNVGSFAVRFKKLRLFFRGNIDAFFFLVFQVLAIFFFLNFEQVDSFDFNFITYLYVSFFYLLDVSLFFFIVEEYESFIKKLFIMLPVSIINGMFLTFSEVFSPSLLFCYLLSFVGGLFILMTKGVHKSLILFSSFSGISLLSGLSLSTEANTKYLVSISLSDLNTSLFFISLTLSNFYFVKLKSERLKSLSDLNIKTKIKPKNQGSSV